MNGKLLHNGWSIPILQDENGSGDWLHKNMNVLKTSELYI